MTTDIRYTQEQPVDDRYAPPSAGELDEIGKVFTDSRLSGGAPVVPAYELALAMWFGVKRAIAVNSGSSALHATLVALGVRPGDEVIVPATAPIPTAMPILTCGAIPVIADTLPDELALNPDDVAQKLSKRTKAAISLPLWGYPADDTAAAAIFAAAGVPLIEDACQAHGTLTRGRPAGTLHRAGCFSTHDRKLLSTGEGGFVLTDDEELAERIDFYTHLGHLQGEVHGVNYKLAAPLAAIGLRRLPGLNTQLRARKANTARLLSYLATDGILAELPYGHDDAPSYYNLVLASHAGQAKSLAAAFASAGLPPDSIRYGYQPLYHRKIFTRFAVPCPNAEALAASTFQLPVHPGLTEAALRWTAERLRVFAEGQLP